MLVCRFLTRFLVWPGLLAFGLLPAVADDRHSAIGNVTRQLTFKLTYLDRDLVWLGDPASPTALVYPRPGARPIATDVCVTSLTTTKPKPARRYMREARITPSPERTVYAFTNDGERIIGAIDAQGGFAPNDTYVASRRLLPSWPQDASTLHYDATHNLLYYEVDVPGPVLTESLDFLPLDLVDDQDRPVAGHYAIDYVPADSSRAAVVSLTFTTSSQSVALATATVPRVFRRGDAQLGSFDNALGTYLAEDVYRAGRQPATGSNPSVTFSVPGEFTQSIASVGPSLVLAADADTTKQPMPASRAKITIDGNFDDWRNVAGVDDPRGDLVPYLEYVPDVDLLEFKVAHDDEHIYLYARVTGRVGHTHPHGGRSYFYAYMDVDQNPGTGFLPTRDDNCYYGVEIGDDCEVQFEFVDNQFRKTFYGFCGLGGDDHVLRQIVTLGKSQYGRLDEHGRERAHYKSEYTYRGGITEITEDLKHGTSDSIRLAVAPDGSEVEVVSTLAGFLKNAQGEPTVQLGQTIDVAAGMECDSKAYPGKQQWAADSTLPIRGYRLAPVPRD